MKRLLPSVHFIFTQLAPKIKKAQLKMIEENPLDIHWLDNPSKKLQLKAVQLDYEAINWIKNPCREAIRLAKLKEKLEKL